MSSTSDIEVNFFGTEDFSSALQSSFLETPDQVRVMRSGTLTNPREFNWGLTQIAEVITIVTAAFYFGELALRVYKALKVSKSKKVVLQTPIRTIEIANDDTLTPEQIEKILKQLVKIGK